MKWQEEFLKCEEKVIIVDHERGAGISCAIVEKILETYEDKSKVFYLGMRRDVFLEKLKDLNLKPFIKQNAFNEIELIYNDKKILVYFPACEEDFFSNRNSFDYYINEGRVFSFTRDALKCKQIIHVLPDMNIKVIKTQR